MTTTNKLVSIESVMEIVSNFAINSKFLMEISTEIEAIPAYFEHTKGGNYALLQKLIEEFDNDKVIHAYGHSSIVSKLKEIQSQLTEGVEYEIGKEYEFSDDGKNWTSGLFSGYQKNTQFGYRYIRPISPISSEEQQAIELLKKSGYTVTK